MVICHFGVLIYNAISISFIYKLPKVSMHGLHSLALISAQYTTCEA